MTNGKKLRLLFIGDACVPTGFSRVLHNICAFLKDHWDLHVIGVNYTGDPHEYPYPIYPARNGGDIWGIGRCKELLPALSPHALVMINDPWIVTRLLQEIDKRNIPVAAYMPVDARNVPQYFCRGLDGLDLAIFYTDFGRREVELGGYQGISNVIPHGVDTELYKPMAQAQCRKLLRYDDRIPSDAFVVGNVNRNQPRKRLDLTIEYFAEWVHQKRLPPSVYLNCHCAKENTGWNLAQLASYYGINNRLMLPDPERVTPSWGFPEEEMPLVYNSFDVQLSTTLGEGWGLPVFEAMACGVPQIVPNWSGLGEWAAGAAYFVPCSATVVHIGINTIGGVADKAATVAALDRMYRDAELRRKYAELALVRAREPRFRWQAIAESMHHALYQMVWRANMERKRREQQEKKRAAEEQEQAAQDAQEVEESYDEVQTA